MKNILYQESIVEIKHLFRMMRNTLLALFVFAGTAFATESYSQTMKVTVVADNMSTGKVISEIEKQTDYLFVYNVNEVNLKRNVKVNAQNKSVAEVLNKVFEGTDIYYAMEGKNIMLMSKAKDGEVAQQANKVTGIVKDTNGEPIIGANVTVKGQSIGTITDIDGRFVLDAPKNAVLQITYIGYVDYTNVNGRYSEHFVGKVPPFTREAAAHFVMDGKHYIYTSGTTSYTPNPSEVAVFDDYHGEYTVLGNPHIGDEYAHSFCSQITSVIKIPGKDLYVAMADRWLPHTNKTDIPKKDWQSFLTRYKDHRPYPKDFATPKVVDRFYTLVNPNQDVYKATYVFLPIVVKDGIPMIEWKDEWKLENYE